MEENNYRDLSLFRETEYRSLVEEQGCFIYILFKNNEIIYIGSSNNLFKRINGHLRKEFDKIFN